MLDPASSDVEDLFRLDFSNGEVYTDQTAAHPGFARFQPTVERLKLNNPDLCRARLDHFRAYLAGEISENGLQHRSPFVYAEAKRQGLL